MPYDAGIIAALEDALSECFHYHRELKLFLIRSGVSESKFEGAKGRADARARASCKYTHGTKRYIVQELFEIYSKCVEGDIVFAALITGVVKGMFPDATDKAKCAISYLKERIKNDHSEKILRSEELDRERKRREQETNAAELAHTLDIQKAKDDLRAMFFALSCKGDVQKRGYLLEDFLRDLFKHEGVDPKASFKNIGEQIDGSFQWNGQTHLVEAKWVAKPISGSEFGAFMYKISGKTVDTRGLYISINGYSKEALKGLTTKGDLRFVCLDGAHIVRGLEFGQSFLSILKAAWRHASETGEAYFPVNAMGC